MRFSSLVRGTGWAWDYSSELGLHKNDFHDCAENALKYDREKTAVYS